MTELSTEDHDRVADFEEALRLFGLKAQDAAELLGVTVVTVSRWRNKHRRLRQVYLDRLYEVMLEREADHAEETN